MTETIQNTPREKTDKIINSGQLGVVLQCGGRARRVGNEKKPLINLLNGDRPLSNLLKDIPLQVPVYIHLLREHKDSYTNFLSNNNLGHKIMYIEQEEEKLYDQDKNLLTDGGGLFIAASNGPATFVNHFSNPPEYMLTIDGARLGIDFHELKNALSMLIEHEEKDAVSFVFRVSSKELMAEKKRFLKNKRLKYARVNCDSQNPESRIYEGVFMPPEIPGDKKWLAFDGAHLVRTKSIGKELLNEAKSFVPSESIDGLYTGYTYQIKFNNLLKGFNGRETGLEFLLYEINTSKVILAVKSYAEIKRYPSFIKRGVFDYRKDNSNWGQTKWN